VIDPFKYSINHETFVCITRVCVYITDVLPFVWLKKYKVRHLYKPSFLVK
jgi:hypothetical protein